MGRKRAREKMCVREWRIQTDGVRSADSNDEVH